MWIVDRRQNVNLELRNLVLYNENDKVAIASTRRIQEYFRIHVINSFKLFVDCLLRIRSKAIQNVSADFVLDDL